MSNTGGTMFKLIAPIGAATTLFAVSVAGACSREAGASLCAGSKPSCYETIQAAADAAHDGDTITIEAGTFDGGVRIENSVKLIGAGAAATIVKGGGPVVTVGSRTGQRSLTVSIAGVTITGGVSNTNPSGRCGADVPQCGPGYLRATALAGGIEIAPLATVTISNSVVTGNRATPTVTVPSVSATCPNGPCPFTLAVSEGEVTRVRRILEILGLGSSAATYVGLRGAVADARGSSLPASHNGVGRSHRRGARAARSR
jgi:hypothetical protein